MKTQPAHAGLNQLRSAAHTAGEQGQATGHHLGPHNAEGFRIGGRKHAHLVQGPKAGQPGAIQLAHKAHQTGHSRACQEGFHLFPVAGLEAAARKAGLHGHALAMQGRQGLHHGVGALAAH